MAYPGRNRFSVPPPAMPARRLLLVPFVVLVTLLLPPAAARAQASPAAPEVEVGLPSIALPPELARVLRDYERAWRARDAAALAALFAPDGFVLRPGHPPTRGRAAIEAAYAASGGPLRLRALAFGAADSVAYVIGAYRALPERPDAGKFILALRRAPSGRWEIAADMDNGNG